MAQNGAGIPGANVGVYSGVNGVIMPSAGHYPDMQTLMQNMETLSGWLQQNREEWEQVQEGLGRVERLSARLPRDEQVPLTNGDAQSHPDEPQLPTITQLQTALSATQARNAELEATLQTHSTLQTLYEETLSDATLRIRQYTHSQQEHVLALHKHYTHLLAQSRNETIEAQLTHQAWQGHLQRLSENVREADRAREEERRPWVGRIRGLKEENRILRKMAGWEPAVDSDEEDAAEDSVLERGREAQMAGQGGAAGGQGLEMQQ